jgi:hypothetical protein
MTVPPQAYQLSTGSYSFAEQLGAGEVVVEDDVGDAEAFSAAKCQQPGVAGARANEVHFAVRLVHSLLSELSCSP